MSGYHETLLEMERRHIREGSERITRQEAIIARLGDGNRSDTAILAREILTIMRSSLDLAKRHLRYIEERSKDQPSSGAPLDEHTSAPGEHAAGVGDCVDSEAAVKA